MKAGPVTKVGPLGVPGPGGLADLVAPGEGRAGDGNGVEAASWTLRKIQEK